MQNGDTYDRRSPWDRFCVEKWKEEHTDRFNMACKDHLLDYLNVHSSPTTFPIDHRPQNK